MDQKFYRIHSHRLTNWGDYGDILQHGITAHLARVGGRLSLERTGPYMPPVNRGYRSDIGCQEATGDLWLEWFYVSTSQ